MKLKLEKLPGGGLRVTFAPGGNKAPVTVTLDRDQVPLLVTLLETARRADHFTFELDV